MSNVRGRVVRSLLVVAVLALSLVPTVAAKWPHQRTIDVQLLAVNDLHGQITTGRTVAGRPVGGAAYLAAYVDRERQENPRGTVLVHDGDAVGASPPVSALLQDEPTIAIMNAMGFDLGVVGNHEFDEGVDEMFRLIRGGCHPVTDPLTGCFEGADFPYLAANVVDTRSGRPILPPYQIQTINGVRIGFIGVVTDETPSIVIAGATEGLTFLDEAQTVNRYVDQLQRRGVQTIVVLAHLGGFPADGVVSGEIADFANAVDDEVDVILSGHTHQGYATTIDGKLVTQAWSYSTALADVDLVIARFTGAVVSSSGEIIDTWNDAIAPDPEIAAMVAHYEQLVGPIVDEVVGVADDDITREPSPAGEQELGNLIADAQRWKMDTDFAFMNPGGIRADIAAGEVTWGELFSVQPFANDLVAMDLTGDQIYRLLNQQWQGARTRFLQISGLEVDYDPNRSAGDRIVEVRVAGGGPIDRATTYRVTVNSFLAGGGDNFTVLTEGTNRAVGPVDLDALVDFIAQLSQPFNATIEGRIDIVTTT